MNVSHFWSYVDCCWPVVTCKYMLYHGVDIYSMVILWLYYGRLWLLALCASLKKESSDENVITNRHAVCSVAMAEINASVLPVVRGASAGATRWMRKTPGSPPLHDQLKQRATGPAGQLALGGWKSCALLSQPCWSVQRPADDPGADVIPAASRLVTYASGVAEAGVTRQPRGGPGIVLFLGRVGDIRTLFRVK